MDLLNTRTKVVHFCQNRKCPFYNQNKHTFFLNNRTQKKSDKIAGLKKYLT